MTLCASQRLFETYLSPLLQSAHGTAYYVLQNSEAAERLVQQTVAQTFRAFSGYAPPASFTVWFMKAMIELLRSEIPQESNASARLTDTVQVPAPKISSPSLTVLSTQQITAAFARLLPQTRLVVALYFMQEFSYAQIAEISGSSVSSVRAHLHQGRWQLYRFLCSADTPPSDSLSGECVPFHG